MNHITVHRKGQPAPGPLHCKEPNLFSCPFCSSSDYKPTEYHQIMAHLASHQWKAIKYGEYIIYSCKLGCGGRAVHFHCCSCPRSYRNRSDLLKHLKSHPLPEGQPPPPTGAPTGPPASTDLPAPTEPPPPPSEPPRPIRPPRADAEPPQLPRAPTQPETSAEPAVPAQPRAPDPTRPRPEAGAPEPPSLSPITVHRKGQPAPGPLHCKESNLFSCPFCSSSDYKPTEYHQIMAHLASHQWKAIEYGEYIMYSCKLGCGGRAVHFHCCSCPRSYRNRSELLKHLKSHPLPADQPPPPTGAPTGPLPPSAPPPPSDLPTPTGPPPPKNPRLHPAELPTLSQPEGKPAPLSAGSTPEFAVTWTCAAVVLNSNE